MPYILGFVVEQKNVLSVGKNNLLDGTDSIHEAMLMLPDYSGSHSRGYEASMSSCISWMIFSPRLFYFKDLAAIADAMLDSMVYVGRSLSGNIRYTHLKEDYVPDVAHKAVLIA